MVADSAGLRERSRQEAAMSEILDFDDPFVPIPAAVEIADPVAAMRGLLYRVGRLEHDLADQRQFAQAELREVLLDLVALADEVNALVEHWGITTRAQEATALRNVMGLGRKLLLALKRHRVEPITTIGAPPNSATCDVVGSEIRENVAPGVVLREVQIGYTWANGVLRRAQVVVSAAPAAPPGEGEPPAQGGTLS
jgi:hypothetical protein